MKKKSRTYVAKAIDTSVGWRPKSSRRGLLDAAAKRVVASRMILAWIVHCCVPEAADVPIDVLAHEAIPGKIQIGKTPVWREDAEDPKAVQMGQTEDTSITEGTVRYDILFDLTLPGKEPITVIINVEMQNRSDLPHPLDKRAMAYVARLLSQQGPDYRALRKVYSIWIVNDPAREEENTVVRYAICKTVDGEAMPSAGRQI